MKFIHKKLMVVGGSLAGYLANASFVFAQTQQWSGVCIQKEDVATIQGIQCLVANILSVFLTIVGMAAFIMVVVAAFQFLLSGGNSQQTEKARNSMTYAIIGLVVALSAFIILNLISSFTGVKTILQFQIPGDKPANEDSPVIFRSDEPENENLQLPV